MFLRISIYICVCANISECNDRRAFGFSSANTIILPLWTGQLLRPRNPSSSDEEQSETCSLDPHPPGQDLKDTFRGIRPRPAPATPLSPPLPSRPSPPGVSAFVCSAALLESIFSLFRRNLNKRLLSSLAILINVYPRRLGSQQMFIISQWLMGWWHPWNFHGHISPGMTSSTTLHILRKHLETRSRKLLEVAMKLSASEAMEDLDLCANILDT